MSSYSNYRSGASPESAWRKDPTLIPQPSNRSRNDPAHPSGTNPYGHLNKAQSKTFGNPTSTRTLVNTAVKVEGRPKKRPKIDHTFTTGTKQLIRSSRSGNEANHSHPQRTSKLQPDYTIVNDDEEIAPEIIPNSDELDCLSSFEVVQPSSSYTQSNHPSKYPFSKSKALAGNEGISSRLVPDGINTQWVDKNYGAAKDKGHDTSDPIESDEHHPDYETRRGVKELTQVFEIFEKNTNPRKLDLLQMQTKSQGKLKMKKQFPAKEAPTSRSVIPMKRKIEDRIATSTTLRGPGDIGPVPIKDVFIDQSFYYHSSEHKLCAFSSPNRDLYIKADGDIIFDLNAWTQDLDNLEWSVGDSPVWQIQSQSTGSLKLVTIHCCPSSSMEKKDCTNLFEKLRRLFDATHQARSEQLLQVAKQQLAAEGAKSRPSGVSSTQKLPPSKKPSKLPRQYQEALRYTPSPEDDISLGLQPVRQISQTRSSIPLQAGAPRRSTRNLPPEKSTDQDKVILVYPQGIPGAVNITNSDLARLKPGEFLNDTLIEFGLKLWLKRLEATQPELASQVHIFNSFFYKKLNNKKNDVAAFDTVKKWTSKFDLFQKKYIIVPINEHMHWYLAIIYEPEHVLSSTAEDPSPRKRTRLSAKMNENRDEFSTVDAYATTEGVKETTIDVTTISTPSSEAEVERNLDVDFQSSCNIETLPKHTEDNAEDDAHSDLSYVSELGPSTEQSFSGGIEGALRSVSKFIPDYMDIELGEDVTIPAEPGTKTNLRDLLSPGGNSRNRIYQSAKSIGKQKRKSPSASNHIDVAESTDCVQSPSTPKTYIFTFDSLGTNHPHAIKKLGQYLRMEAKDKRNVLNAGIAGGKTALVPVQPNFCDCGVYLLHFAQTFVSDPDRYCRLILSQSRTVANEERQQLWNDKKVADMRDELSERIQSLSIKWQKERALKEKDARLQATSGINAVDSDSDIEMPSPVKKSGRAVRMRG